MKNEKDRLRKKAAEIGGWAYSQVPLELNTPKLPMKKHESKIPAPDSISGEKVLPSPQGMWAPRDAKKRLW